MNGNNSTRQRMPVVFVGHGSPMNIIENNSFTAGWKTMADSIPVPRSILCVSAHWFGPGQEVSGTAEPETIHDFYGFPDELYGITYPAPGSPDLARRTATLPGISVGIDHRRGLDHGAWSVLHFMYPGAGIPVCQFSVNASAAPEENYITGTKLAPLRDEGVLIIGSGNVVHNLHMADWEYESGFPWADEFDKYIKEAILAGNHQAVINYQNAGKPAASAFYHRDHFDPLLYTLGAAAGDTPDKVSVYNDSRVMGSLSMTSYIIG